MSMKKYKKNGFLVKNMGYVQKNVKIDLKK